MNKKMIPSIRLTVQLLCVGLTAVGFFTNFQVTMVIIMAATFLAGTFYCGWVCPYGTFQDMFSKWGRALGIKKRRMPASVQRYLKYNRYIVAAIVMLSASDLIFSIMSYDPRNSLTALITGSVTTIGALAVILSFGIIAMFFDRPFCNYLCYEGAKYGLFSSLRFITIRRNEHSCINCGKCDKACPMNIDVSKCDQLNALQCINCLECTAVCPAKNTLTYGLVRFDKKVKRRYGYVASAVVIGILSILLYNGITGESLINSSEKNNATEVEASGGTTELTAEEIALLGDAAGISDGVYTGTASGFRGLMTVEVTVSKQMITQVKVTDHVDDAKWYNRANRVIPDEIIDTQSTDISAVSGATYSSYGIINAVKNALENATAQ